MTLDGRSRLYIEAVSPDVDGGTYAIKRVVGDSVEVQADLIVDGHDLAAGDLLFRQRGEPTWQRHRLRPLVNDRYVGHFEIVHGGFWEFTVEAWVDHFSTQVHGLERKVSAGQLVALELRELAEFVASAAERASGSDQTALRASAEQIGDAAVDEAERVALAVAEDLQKLMARHPDRSFAVRHEPAFSVFVDRPRAKFSSWYEFFPRSFGRDGTHGTFQDAARVLPYIADLGFDVVYLPPIHPIGATFRKGKNNSLECEPDDVGSPWAIGGAGGGHKSIHPELGTVDDFRRFCARAQELGMEVALDIAFQVSPDHPYVKAHPEWFKKRADGSIQYAENPPKKYQDIYPFYFETEAHSALWEELKSVFEYWISLGVKIFRVDNPHTKSIRFWQWCLASIRESHPDVLFLAEAFTRPKLMQILAKVGFSQSYTYFTWRVTKYELTEYMRELTRAPMVDYFRPNFWPNTPDILPDHLQSAPRSAFEARFVLAATLCSNYGIYGPAFELMESVPREGAGEYADNEKYELRRWELERPDSLRYLIARVNRARHENVALQNNESLLFHPINNEQILVYSKTSADKSSVVLMVVNLDPYQTQAGWVHLDLHPLGLSSDEPFVVYDALSGTRYTWQGSANFVELDPAELPAHLFVVERPIHRETEFDEYE